MNQIINEESKKKEYRSNRKIKVLVVEDNERKREELLKLLEREHITRDIATNGLEALKACDKKKYDLVFMKCEMPIMSGIAAAQAIRAMEWGRKSTHIVGLASNEVAGERENCISGGMDDFISNPNTKEGIERALDCYYINQKALIEETRVDTADRIDTIVNRLVDELHFESSTAKQMICEYASKLQEEHSALSNYLESNQEDKAITLLHRIKGTSGNLRMKELCSMVFKFEEGLKGPGKIDYAGYLKELKSHIDKLSEDVNQDDPR